MWGSYCNAAVYELNEYQGVYTNDTSTGLAFFEWYDVGQYGPGTGWGPQYGMDAFTCGLYSPLSGEYSTFALSHNDIVIADGAAFVCCFGGRGSASVKPHFVRFDGWHFNGTEITYNGCPEFDTWQDLGGGKYCINERLWNHCGGSVSLEPEEAGLCATKSMSPCKTFSHCGIGYYKSGSSCIPCPDGGLTQTYNNQDGADVCYIPKGYSFTDAAGTGTYSGNCYYSG